MRRSIKIVYENKHDSEEHEYDYSVNGEEEEDDEKPKYEPSVRTIDIERPNIFYEIQDTSRIKSSSQDVKAQDVISGGNGSQKFQELFKRLKRSGQLFEDPDFPAESQSLDPNSRNSHLEWKRPNEVSPDPKFIKDGATRFDVVQGNLGNCWFLAALGALCSDQKLLFHVVPKEQNFEKDYVGAFRFNFWQEDHWVEVIVDDRLPYSGNKLNFTQSADKDEFWTALMEKAYAKLNGSYEVMKAGYSSEAMSDFTGGIVETFYFDEDQPEDMFDQLKDRMDCGSLMTAGTTPTSSNCEQDIGNGLLSGHSYTVTAFNKIELHGEEFRLIRLRNPWGDSEWRGAWSDHSREWESVSKREKDRLNLKIEEDGEFWMPYEEFLIYYDKIEVCHQSPDVLDDGSGRWNEVREKSSWIAGKTAGGRRTLMKTFHLNPRFEFTLNEESDRRDGNGHFVISLTQLGRRKKQLPFLSIGFSIYQVSEKGPKVGPIFFRMRRPVVSSAQVNVREISGQYRLPAGDYFVVPSTFDADEEGDFMVRIFMES